MQVFPGSRYVGMVWAGRVISGLCMAALTMSAVMKFLQPPMLLEEMARFEIPTTKRVMIGVIELICVLLYAIPRTAALGAVLLTGYLGGATLTHLRIDDPIFGPVVIGIFVWLGLWFRDARVRALLPLR
jgi:Na+/proline symporter